MSIAIKDLFDNHTVSASGFQERYIDAPSGYRILSVGYSWYPSVDENHNFNCRQVYIDLDWTQARVMGFCEGPGVLTVYGVMTQDAVPEV